VAETIVEPIAAAAATRIVAIRMVSSNQIDPNPLGFESAISSLNNT
jgi:hypothetical protein